MVDIKAFTNNTGEEFQVILTFPHDTELSDIFKEEYEAEVDGLIMSALGY